VLVRAYDAEEDADDLLDEAERTIFSIAEGRMRSGFVKLSELVDGGYAMLEQLQANRGLVTGVPSGFVELDEMTSGFQKSDLIILAARPSQGKTAMALNIAYHAAVDSKSPVPVAIFSLEMSTQQLTDRLLAAESFVDS